MGFQKFLDGPNFGAKFLEISEFNFFLFLLIERSNIVLQTLKLKCNTYSVTHLNFLQSWSKKRDFEYFRDSEARHCEIDPQMYLESNRKPGSKVYLSGRRHISTSCLAYGAQKMPFLAVFLAGVAPRGAIVPKLLLYFVGLLASNILFFG